MTLYQKLDYIADSYNPLLLIFALYIIFKAFKRSKARGTIKLILLITLMAIVYAVQWIDNQFAIWPYFNSDYSTHTAFALAIIMFFIFERKKYKTTVAISFGLYILLMLYQQYHTLTDIISTIIVLSPAMYGLAYYAKKLQRSLS